MIIELDIPDSWSSYISEHIGTTEQLKDFLKGNIKSRIISKEMSSFIKDQETTKNNNINNERERLVDELAE